MLQTTPIEIDGRQGEGGGQILRTSLSLALALGRALRLVHIRAARKRPGLLRQHLTCVRAAAEISGGQLEGAELGSESLTLTPGTVAAGQYGFAVGSAGSTLLVLQTVLPPLLRAGGESVVRIQGGTHNPMAPTFGFVEASLRPLLARMGAQLDLELERPGFYPAGGGAIVARIRAGTPAPLVLEGRGEADRHLAQIGSAHIDPGVADREWDTLQRALHWTSESRQDLDLSNSSGPGNFIELLLSFEHVTQVFTTIGAPGVSGKRLASRLASQARRSLAGNCPVEEHLADQLMLPMALLAGGRYRASRLSLHSHTNADVINQFVPGTVELDELGPRGFGVRINPIFGGPSGAKPA
ncbi:MAG: RNA 3'-terminal phosphate cyclase [Planctomycetes bacterium]|nr:RNA 3'-terminal phosphate cyclase [Planctomycetota bacterium]